MQKRDILDNRFNEYFILNASAQDKISNRSSRSSSHANRVKKRRAVVVTGATDQSASSKVVGKQDVSTAMKVWHDDMIGSGEMQLNKEAVQSLIEECGGMFFVKSDIQRLMQRHMNRFEKFKIDFCLTRNTLKETLKQMFEKGREPEPS